MRSTVFLPLLAAIALAGSALATPPLRMDSQGVVQAKAVSATDGGVHAPSGLSAFGGGIAGFTVPSIVPAAPTVTSNITLDGGGSTTMTYAVTACTTATCAAGSESTLSANGTTTTSIATVSSTYPNLITIPATVGAVAFGVWNTTAGGREGLLAVVAQNACSNAGDYCGATYLDKGNTMIADLSPGLAGYGDAGPVNDLSGEVSATALFVGAKPARVISGVNGAAPTVPEYEEIFTYQIASGTAAGHDAGFARTFNTAPGGCTCSIITGDGGALIGTAGASQNISTTGFSFTSSANVSETLQCSCVGN